MGSFNVLYGTMGMYMFNRRQWGQDKDRQLETERNGAKTLVVERGNCLGGMATRGLVGPFMTCYDKNGRNQIIRGLFKDGVDSTNPESWSAAEAEGCHIYRARGVHPAAICYNYHQNRASWAWRRRRMASR